MVLALDGTPVIVKTSIEQNFKITAKQLEKAITPKTKMVVLNSPSNPTGMAYTETELTALAEVMQQYPDVIIMTDDIYEHILWSQEKFVNILNVAPELAERTVVINGVSKAYAMTGWRIGFAAGPTDIIKAMKKLQSQSTSNPCSISQAAAEAALKGDQNCLNTMLTKFKERHDYLIPALNAIDGIECRPADGAFYAFPDVTKLIAKLGLSDDVALTEFLLENAEVAVVPGSAFGIPGCIRLSSATSLETLKTAIKRIQAAV
jgi:aspartate aminotransferase